MDIQFCDLCNESIPQSDLRAGRAFRQSGRWVCSTCDKAMGGGGAPKKEPKAAAESSRDNGPAAEAPVVQRTVVAGGGAGVALGLIAILTSGAGLAFFMDRMDSSEARLERLGSELAAEGRARTAAIQGQSVTMDERLAEASASTVQGLEQISATLEAGLSELRSLDAERAGALARMQEELQSLRTNTTTREENLAQRMDTLSERLINMEADQRFYADRITEFEERLHELASRPAAPAFGGLPLATGGASGDAELGPAPWEPLLADLSHANPGIRMEAVYDLAETKDARVVQHLVPMLEDSDLFVRMATARALMDLDARPGVPALIETLEDPSGAVREAAMVALRKIAGREFGFEPLASESDRSKRVKAWRDWWKQEGEAFLASA